MSDQEHDKTDLRETIRARLDALDAEQRREASRSAGRRLCGLEAFHHASVVMLYMPIVSEVDTVDIAISAFQSGKTVCVPKVDWERKTMHAVAISSLDDDAMDAGDHGVRSPRGGRLLVPTSIDLVVVPALAYDVRGNRLGRGGGYYDRFLPRLRRSATTIGLCFDAQVIDEVPAEDHDVRVHMIVTDRRVTRTRASRSRR